MSERTQRTAMERVEAPRLDASDSINLTSQPAAGTSPIPHPDEWPVVRLADLTLKIGSGATPRGGSENYLPERVSFALIRSQNVFDRHFDCAGLAFISDEQAQGLQNVILQSNDLLLNITGDGITFARCCAVPEDVLPACVNQHVSIIRVDPSLADPGYVLAYLTHPSVKAYIESFNAGGSRRAITKGHIESFRLPYKYRVVVAGNHDLFFAKQPKQARKQLTNAIYLENNGVTIEGLSFWGCPITPVPDSMAFAVECGAASRKYWDKVPTETDVLVTHGPPFRVLDTEHVLAPHMGCDQLTRALLRARPRLHVFGHVHGSYGQEAGPHGIAFVNCAVLARLGDGRLGLREPIVVELENNSSVYRTHFGKS